MDELLKYLKNVIGPRDESEFCECDEFDIEKFANLKQDGFMVSKTMPPNDLEHIEYVSLLNDIFLIKKSLRPLEWLLDDNSIRFENSRDPIYRRLIPPPCETVNHPFIISQILQASGGIDKMYLEYGVRDGTSLRAIAPFVKHCVGVDINACHNIPSNSTFYKMFTDEFSRDVLPQFTFHFAFIDADHKFESTFKDFENLFPSIQSGGYIFLHDTYPCEAFLLDPKYCNDCYMTPIAIKQKYGKQLELLTLPLNPGVTIIRKI